MASALRLTLAVFVFSSVRCNITTTISTETDTTEGLTETATAETVSSQLSQTIGEIDNSATTIMETTIMSTTLNDLTTIPSTTNNEMTTMPSTILNDITTIQSGISTSGIIEDEQVTSIKINDDVSSNNSLITDSEPIDGDNTSTVRVDLTDVTIINNVTDIIDTTITNDDANDEFSSTSNSVEGARTRESSVNIEATRCRKSTSQRVGIEHGVRKRVESWDDLQMKNDTDKVNTVVFDRPMEATEWFVIYDQRFRDVFAQITTSTFNKMMSTDEDSWSTNGNCTVFTPDDIVYVSPSPFKQGQITVVSFIVCDISGDFCLEFKHIEATEKTILENKLNLTVVAFEQASSRMSYYNDCQRGNYSDPYEKLKLVFIFLLVLFAIVMFSIMIIVTKSRKKTRSYNTSGVAYLSNRFLKHCPGSGQNLASDQQCQLEEITETPPTFRNKHLKRAAPNIPTLSLEIEPPKFTTNMEAKL